MELIRRSGSASDDSASGRPKLNIPVLHEAGDRTARKPIIQFKELEPDWQRYNSWRASLIESYTNWLRRWKRLYQDCRE
jgi:hypothetical protein